MLTREEAKTKNCPTRLAAYVSGLAVHNNNTSASYQIDMNKKCIAENCPKWKDIYIEYENIKSHCNDLECTKCGNLEDYQKNCLTCDKHFGRCNG